MENRRLWKRKTVPSSKATALWMAFSMLLFFSFFKNIFYSGNVVLQVVFCHHSIEIQEINIYVCQGAAGRLADFVFFSCWPAGCNLIAPWPIPASVGKVGHSRLPPFLIISLLGRGVELFFSVFWCYSPFNPICPGVENLIQNTQEMKRTLFN